MVTSEILQKNMISTELMFTGYGQKNRARRPYPLTYKSCYQSITAFAMI